MTVTRIEELSRSRCKIYLEDSFAFVLYKGELRLFGVREQEELSEESYREIMQEVLPKTGDAALYEPFAEQGVYGEQTAQQIKRGRLSAGKHRQRARLCKILSLCG